jgi:hypothetical protein
MRLYVAYRRHKRKGVPRRIASGSQTTIKTKMREHLSTKWLVATYQLKPNVPTMIQVIENFNQVEADEVERYEVTANGRLRKGGLDEH